MQKFNLIFLFVAFCLEGVHHTPDFKIITLFDESEETAAGFPNVGVGIEAGNRGFAGVAGYHFTFQLLILKLLIGQHLCLASFWQNHPSIEYSIKVWWVFIRLSFLITKAPVCFIQNRIY